MNRIVAILSVIGLLTACGEGVPDADFTYAAGQEHNHLDPVKMSWSHDIRLAHCLYDTLVIFDFNDFVIRPGAAERWERSDDGLIYTFYIRANARWSNGDPVTAQDYIHAWRRAMLPDFAADYTQLMFHIRGAESFFNWRTEQLKQYAELAKTGSGGHADAAESLWQLTGDEFQDRVGLSAPDDKTLVVRLTQSTSYFLELVAFSIYMPVHAHSVEAATSVNPRTGMRQTRSDYWSNSITNGPYQIAKREFKRYLLLTANDHYWDRAAMKNSRIREDIITNAPTALTAYHAGEVDFLPDMPSAGPIPSDLSRADRPDVHLQKMAGTYFYNFNCQPRLADGRENPLADVRVRRALSMAIDRKIIVKRVTQLNQPIARSYVPVGAIGGYRPPVEDGITFDPVRARQLLADAGYSDGSNLKGLSILYNTNAYHELSAQAIKSMWQEYLGVVVTLEGEEGKAFSVKLKKQDYTIARAAWFGDYADATTFLEKMTTNDGNNDCRWSNEQFDRLIEQAAFEPDPKRRNQVLASAESILLREAPMALIFQYVNLYLYDPQRLHGLRPNAWNRWRFEQVEVGGKRQ